MSYQRDNRRRALLFAIGLSVASIAASDVQAATTEEGSAVERALSAHCPDAQSEEVIECARQVTAEADKRIRRDLCAYRPDTCAVAFDEFVARRDELLIALESAINERSVVAQIEVALFALQTTLAFEEVGAFKHRRDLEQP